MSSTLRVALGEYDTGWHDAAGSLARAEQLVRDAARDGAQLVVLPEMATTGFTMDAATQAEPVDGTSVAALRRMAKEHAVHLVAGVAMRECTKGVERVVNAALLIGDDGGLLSIYRKRRVFGYAGEDRTYAAGTEAVTATVHGVRVALFVCYDLRFPELFRQVARDVDAMIVIANWPAARRVHWDALIQARAIENQCYVVAVNRIGEGGGITYDGGSAAFDPWGSRVVAATSASFPSVRTTAVVNIDAARVRAVRDEYPFLRDYRG